MLSSTLKVSAYYIASLNKHFFETVQLNYITKRLLTSLNSVLTTLELMGSWVLDVSFLLGASEC